MGAGKGGSANKMDPFTMMMMNQAMSRSQPVTQLPQEMVPQAPPVMSGSEVLGNGLGMEKSLDKVGLGVTNRNPLFSDNAPAAYRDKYYDMAVKPMLGGAAISQYLQGNLNPEMAGGGNTLAGSYLSNTELQGRNQAFFAGEDYRNNLANQLFQRRNALFGQNVGLEAQQNQADVNRGLALNDQSTSRLGLLNQFQLGSQGNFLGAMNSGMDRQMEFQRMQQQNQAARTANIGNLVGGVFGLGGGLINGSLNRRALSNFGSASSTPSNMFTAPTLSSNFFNKVNF